MPFLNAHLICIPQQHNVITGNCFCGNCKQERFIVAMNEHHRIMRYQYFLPEKETKCLDNLFGSILKLIVQGKVYKHRSLMVVVLHISNLG